MHEGCFPNVHIAKAASADTQQGPHNLNSMALPTLLSRQPCTTALAFITRPRRDQNESVVLSPKLWEGRDELGAGALGREKVE